MQESQGFRELARESLKEIGFERINHSDKFLETASWDFFTNSPPNLVD
jgi:hypothetical protein